MANNDHVLVFGAASAIAYETCKIFASQGAALYLCARREEDLQRLAHDLKVRGAREVRHCTFDALEARTVIAAVDQCLRAFPDLNCLLVAHGTLPEQRRCETDLQELRNAFEINFTSVAVLLSHIAPHFERRKQGTIAVVSSVAGDRGRRSNYVYGSAKGALTIFLSGLRQRLDKLGVTVITIKPGFVDTPMTADFKKGLLFVGPEVIARGIVRAVRKKKPVVYLPWFWKLIMGIIKIVPERIFKKLNF